MASRHDNDGSNHDSNNSTVIVGAGIVGVATAFYLSESGDPASIHIVESSESPFVSASGFAGGFVAPDWFSPPVLPLGRLSFELHQDLAKKHDGRREWGYNRSTSLSLTEDLADRNSTERGDDWLFSGTSRSQVASSNGDAIGDHIIPREMKGPSWLRYAEAHYDTLGAAGSCAQVDPLRLCRFLLAKCIGRGVRLSTSSCVSKVNCSESGILSSVEIQKARGRTTHSEPETFTLTCDRLILTAGAWSQPVLTRLFPEAKISLPIRGLAGYSLTFKSPLWTNKDAEGNWHAVFSGGGHDVDTDFSAELFARSGGPKGDSEVYIAGLNDESLALPLVATGKPPDPEYVEILRRKAISMLSKNSMVHKEAKRDHSRAYPKDLEIVRTGLCWRPITSTGYPIISRISDELLGEGIRTGPKGGVWVAAGHGPWGISLSLGTGKVVSELVKGESTSCDVSGLSLPRQ